MGFFSEIFGGVGRARVMNDAISQLAGSGNKNIILRDVHYEEALKFALQSGADPNSPDNRNMSDSVHFTMNVDGRSYYIFLARHIDGSTYLGVDDVEELTKQFRDRLNNKRG